MKQYSLFELNKEISDALAAQLEPSYWVIAEISQVQVNQKGHCYLELVEKEGDNIRAKMRATIWSYTYRNLITWFENMTKQSLKPGMEILFNAVVQFHEVYGLSLNIKDIDANYTLGERARKKAETIEKLKEDGVFEMNKQLTLPLVPQRIAVISSSTAAGYGDFMNQLESNPYHYHFEVSLFNALMQGQEAEMSLVGAMHKVFEQIDSFDLIVIIRGGGASVDLDCFDGYEIASHIAQFPIPVVTGIGHDRDQTVCDLVAHTSLKTPTAVSEFLILGIKNYEDQLDENLGEIYHLTKQHLSDASILLERLTGKLHRSFQNRSSSHSQRLEGLKMTLQYHTENLLRSRHQSLENLENILRRKPHQLIETHREKITNIEKWIKASSPEHILNRGYSISKINGIQLSKYDGKIKAGDQLETIAKNVELTSEIKSIEKTKKKYGQRNL